MMVVHTQNQNHCWSMITNVATFQVVARCTLIFFYGIVLYSWQWDMTLVMSYCLDSRKANWILFFHCKSKSECGNERKTCFAALACNRHYWSSLWFLWDFTLHFVFRIFFHFFFLVIAYGFSYVLTIAFALYFSLFSFIFFNHYNCGFPFRLMTS